MPAAGPAIDAPAVGEPCRNVSVEVHPAEARAGERALDGFVFLVSNLQTGFGPFVSSYLTQQRWTQGDIGLAMTVGTLVGLLGQVPGGALVDGARSKRAVAAVSVGVIALSALALALWASFPVAVAVMAVHAAASCTLTPAVSAVALGLVGHARAGVRFGRNASFASLGGAVAAVAMGACGYYLSDASVFYVTAVLGIPAILSLRLVAEGAAPSPTQAAAPGAAGPSALLELARNRSLVTFAACICLFHFANAAMLPLAGSALTLRSSASAAPMIAACMVIPQAVVALCAPWVGRAAQRHGRRPFLILCFGALAARGVLFANVDGTLALISVQALDGISASVLGVLMPLVVADVTRGTGRFNLAYGLVATAVNVGASFATTAFGYMADRHGMSAAFLGMGVAACAGALLTALMMPETRSADPAR